MGLIKSASRSSVAHGYEYYKNGTVMQSKKLSDHEFEGRVWDNDDSLYDVFINTLHPRQSHCNCPEACGKKVVCKHQIALFFSFFTDEAEDYFNYIQEYNLHEQRKKERSYEKIGNFVVSMTEYQLQEALFELLFDIPDQLFEKFVRENNIEL